MQITVNGESRPLSAGQTVAHLLDDLGLSGKPVAVEVNRQVIPKRSHESTTLTNGDVIEVVTLVGGG